MNGSNRTLRVVVVAVTAAGGGAGACAQTVDPRGLFFHSFTGSATGSEWSTWGALGPAGRYEFSDLRNGGTYPATFAMDDSFVLDSGVGAGAFSSRDRAVIDFDFGGGTVFHSELMRAPYTDEEFPVFAAVPVLGNAALDGEWAAQFHNVNPRTGVTESVIGTAVTVDVEGSTIRLTGAGGAFYQGVWRSDGQAGFRVIDRLTPDPRYRTFPGSATSVDLNMLGDLRVNGINSMTLTLFFETRGELGTQVQTMQYVELSRVPGPGALGVGALGVLGMTRRRR